MKKFKLLYFLFFTAISILFSSNISVAQKNINIDGYLQNFQTVWKPSFANKLNLTSAVNNRINFTFYTSEAITFNASIRNIIEYGDFVGSIPNYADLATRDNGLLNLTSNNASGESYVFYSNVDRLNAVYSMDNLEIQIGRQRINLGINLVWTPNDIFNSSSFLNFDYVEKAGSDAIRVQYYTGISSSAEFVLKMNSSNDISAAAIYKFNLMEYDFQFLSGVMENNFVLAGGWAGQIGGAGFSGEVTYFRDKENFSNTNGILVAAIGGSYTFKNSLFIYGEFLFNSNGRTKNAGIANNLFSQQYSAKSLSPAKYSLFSEISYPITPLIKADVSSIFNPNDKSFYVGPSLNISLTEDIYLLSAAQFFSGEHLSEWGDYGQFYYLRLKWNF